MPREEKNTHKPKEAASNFLTSSVEEIKKVTWPTRHKAVRLTLLVLGFCFASAIIIGFVDFVLNMGHQALIDLAPQQTTVETPSIGDVTAVTQPQSQQTAGQTQQTSQGTQTITPPATQTTQQTPATSQQTSSTKTQQTQPSQS